MSSILARCKDTQSHTIQNIYMLRKCHVFLIHSNFYYVSVFYSVVRYEMTSFREILSLLPLKQTERRKHSFCAPGYRKQKDCLHWVVIKWYWGQHVCVYVHAHIHHLLWVVIKWCCVCMHTHLSLPNQREQKNSSNSTEKSAKRERQNASGIKLS